MTNYVLYHHGIKGQKWGVRRYQNEDGTLTDAGKRRQASEELAAARKKAKEKGNNPPPDPKAWVRDDISKKKNLAESGNRMTNDLKRLSQSTKSKKEPERLDLSSMSDKELRDQINRELLERQYNSVFNPKKESKGREHVEQILDVAGSVLGVTASALGIALAIKELKG